MVVRSSLLSIIHFGVMMATNRHHMGNTQHNLALNMSINKGSTMSQDSRFWKMRGRDTIVVCLHMGRLVQERVTPWLATKSIEASSQLYVTRYSRESRKMKIQIKSTMLNYRCLRYTMRSLPTFLIHTQVKSAIKTII